MSVGRRAGTTLAVLMFVAASSFLTWTLAQSVPRYAARYEQNCNLCHVNPTGGGMRTLYASQFIVPEELAWRTQHDDVLEGIDPEIAKNIQLGADFRAFYFYSDDDSQNKNFTQMQGDIYLNFQMSDHLSLYFDSGMTRSYELFGSAYVLPANGYLKVGRFMPAYGWKFDDHTMATRAELGFFPPNHTDVGLELGLFPKRFALNASVLNGARGNTEDNNRELGVALRAEYRSRISAVGYALGLSGYHSREADGDHDAGGGFWYVTLKRLTWVGETDWYRIDPAGGSHKTAMVVSNELSYLLRQGLDARLTHDFFDPDWNLKTGARLRWGGGFYVLPSPFLALEALVRRNTVEPGADVSGNDFWETVLQFHFLY